MLFSLRSLGGCTIPPNDGWFLDPRAGDIVPGSRCIVAVQPCCFEVVKKLVSLRDDRSYSLVNESLCHRIILVQISQAKRLNHK